MKAVIQRVIESSVSVDGEIVGKSQKGYMILLGVVKGDTEKETQLLAAKTASLRVFADENGNTYWEYAEEVWHAQYDGYDYYRNTFYACKDEAGNSPSKDVLTKKDGRYQVLKAMEKFVTPEYILPGSNSQDHITMQTKFLNQDIGIMVNGSWVSNEMETTGNMADYGVMKTPVISSITDKLTTVKSDTLLRQLISAIDAVSD